MCSTSEISCILFFAAMLMLVYKHLSSANRVSLQKMQCSLPCTLLILLLCNSCNFEAVLHDLSWWYFLIYIVVGGCTGTCFPERHRNNAEHEHFVLLAMQKVGKWIAHNLKACVRISLLLALLMCKLYRRYLCCILWSASSPTGTMTNWLFMSLGPLVIVMLK